MPLPLPSAEPPPQLPRRYFVADVHLNGQDAPHAQKFREFLQRLAVERQQAEVDLFIAGDLFEFWYEYRAPLVELYWRDLEALETAAQQGVQVHLLFGNRDFRYGKYVRRRLGAEILGDGARVLLSDSRPAWLEHGDLLCTADRAYLRFRAVVRSWPVRFLLWLLPWSVMGRMVERVKRKSAAAKARKSSAVLDIDLAAARARLESTGCRLLICGHTHKPRAEDLGAGLRLLVLPAWCESPGGYVDDGRSLRPFTP
jgi:UDP-2,3-diacylglucosamine hydrolase